MTKKYLMTLVAILSCAMTVAVLTACTNLATGFLTYQA